MRQSRASQRSAGRRFAMLRIITASLGLAAVLGGCPAAPEPDPPPPANDGAPDTSSQRAPIAFSLLDEVTFENALPVTLRSVSPDDSLESLVYEIVVEPANGTLTGEAPDLVYTPRAGFSGKDSFSFRVSVGTAKSNTAKVNITVLPITLVAPDAPVNPTPAHASEGLPVRVDLGWSAASGATSYDIFLGDNSSPQYVGNSTSNSWNPGALKHDTTYYWKVVSRNSAGSATSSVWRFKTQPLDPSDMPGFAPPTDPPTIPANPQPAPAAQGVSINTDLNWDDSSGASSYDVFFGTSDPPPYVGSTASSNWSLGLLNSGTTYHWNVVARNSAGSTPGPAWSFSTQSLPPTEDDSWRSLGSGMNSPVLALTVFNGELIAGGTFTTAGGQAANYIARWDGASWKPLGSGLNNAVYALTVYQGNLIAAGGFTEAGGQAANYIARWNGQTWLPLGDGLDNGVMSLAFYNSELIASGFFSEAGGQPAMRIARWNGSIWRPLGVGLDGSVLAMAPYNGELVAGGLFDNVGGQPASHIARWSGSAWNTLGMGVEEGIDDGLTIVMAMRPYNGELIVAGGFDVAGGQPARRIARWNGSAWHPLGAGLGNSEQGAYALGIYNGELIVGGDMSSAGGNPVNAVARWDGSTWRKLGSGVNRVVWAFEVYHGELIVAGGFTTAGGKPANRIARWKP